MFVWGLLALLVVCRMRLRLLCLHQMHMGHVGYFCSPSLWLSLFLSPFLSFSSPVVLHCESEYLCCLPASPGEHASHFVIWNAPALPLV